MEGTDKYSGLDELKRELEESGRKTREEVLYDKYMVIADGIFTKEDVYGVFDSEIEAHRRLKSLKKVNKYIIKANIRYLYFGEEKLILDYYEVE